MNKARMTTLLLLLSLFLSWLPPVHAADYTEITVPDSYGNKRHARERRQTAHP